MSFVKSVKAESYEDLMDYLNKANQIIEDESIEASFKGNIMNKKAEELDEVEKFEEDNEPLYNKLEEAIHGNDLDKVKKLLSTDEFDVNRVNKIGETPLYIAQNNLLNDMGDKATIKSIIKLLVDKGAKMAKKPLEKMDPDIKERTKLTDKEREEAERPLTVDEILSEDEEEEDFHGYKNNGIDKNESTKWTGVEKKAFLNKIADLLGIEAKPEMKEDVKLDLGKDKMDFTEKVDEKGAKPFPAKPEAPKAPDAPKADPFGAKPEDKKEEGKGGIEEAKKLLNDMIKQEEAEGEPDEAETLKKILDLLDDKGGKKEPKVDDKKEDKKEEKKDDKKEPAKDDKKDEKKDEKADKKEDKKDDKGFAPKDEKVEVKEEVKATASLKRKAEGKDFNFDINGVNVKVVNRITYGPELSEDDVKQAFINNSEGDKLNTYFIFTVGDNKYSVRDTYHSEDGTEVAVELQNYPLFSQKSEASTKYNLYTLANVNNISLVKKANLEDSKWVFQFKGQENVLTLPLKKLQAEYKGNPANLTTKAFFDSMVKTIKADGFQGATAKNIIANFNEKIKVEPGDKLGSVSRAKAKASSETDTNKHAKVSNNGGYSQNMTDACKAQKQDKVNSKEDAGAIESASKKAPAETDMKVSASYAKKLNDLQAALVAKEQELAQIKLQATLEKKTAKCRKIVEMAIRSGHVKCNEQFRQEELLKQASPVKAQEEAMKRTAESMVSDLLALSDEELNKQESYLSNFKVEAEVNHPKPFKLEASLETKTEDERLIEALCAAMQ